MLTSARRGISYPKNTTPRSDTPDVPRDIATLVAALELDVVYAQGTHAARPANPGATLSGYVYWETDTKALFYWDGTAYTQVGLSVASPAAGDAVVFDGTNYVKSSAYPINPTGIAFTGTRTGTKFLRDDFSWQTLANVVVANTGSLPASPADGATAIVRTAHNINPIQLFYNTADQKWYSAAERPFTVAGPDNTPFTGGGPGASFSYSTGFICEWPYFKELYEAGLILQVRYGWPALGLNTGGASSTVTARYCIYSFDPSGTTLTAATNIGADSGLAMACTNTWKAFFKDWADIVISSGPTRQGGALVCEAMQTNTGSGLLGFNGERGINNTGPYATPWCEMRWRNA